MKEDCKPYVGQAAAPTQLSSTVVVVDPTIASEIHQYLTSKYSIEQFDTLVKELMEGDVSQKHHGLIGIRKLVSVVDNVEVMIKKVVASGAVPTLIHLMTQPDHPQLKLEAAWAITNVMTSTGDECELVIQNGGIEGLIHVVRDADTHIGIQGIWGLGNLAADNEKHRNLVVQGGGLDAIFDFYQATHVQSQKVTAIWAMSNFFRHGKCLEDQYYYKSIPIFCEAFLNHIVSPADSETLSDCLWSLSHISGFSDGKFLPSIYDYKIFPQLVQYLSQPLIRVVVPAMRICGNFIAHKNNSYCSELLSYDIINKLSDLLSHEKKAVRKEVVWVLSNIVAEPTPQTQMILYHEQLMDKLFEMLKVDEEKVKQEILYFMKNIKVSMNKERVFQLFYEHKIASIIVKFLKEEKNYSHDFTSLVLELCYSVLGIGETFQKQGQNAFMLEIEAESGLGLLESLQSHQNMLIYQKCVKIIEKYYNIYDSS